MRIYPLGSSSVISPFGSVPHNLDQNSAIICLNPHYDSLNPYILASIFTICNEILPQFSIIVLNIASPQFNLSNIPYGSSKLRGWFL